VPVQVVRVKVVGDRVYVWVTAIEASPAGDGHDDYRLTQLEQAVANLITEKADDCPVQVAFPGLHGRWIDCTFPAGHTPWLHSWQSPGAPVFIMAPPVTGVRNRNGGPLGYPYDP
jgi:hypothetical protein